VIFVKLRQMPPDERATLVIRTPGLEFEPTDVPGRSRAPLYRAQTGEDVAIERLDAGVHWRDRGRVEGEEILVLDGDLVWGGQAYGAGTWLRFPAGPAPALGSATGCRIWVKRGHLG
jgi:hypothetical protein